MIQPTKDCSHRVQSKPIILYYTILALQSSIKVDNAHAPSPSVSIDTVRLQDIYILGGTMIFYSILQMLGQYFYEFHIDNLQAQNGLPAPMNCKIQLHHHRVSPPILQAHLYILTPYSPSNSSCPCSSIQWNQWRAGTGNRILLRKPHLYDMAQ